ncbi:M23 family metallopeptidase [Paraburkholderia bannensis]|uniref:M23 family metallopeptidase n=2 Tax=Paraburkholderia bannensis TaxID=765414 RepID=UPI002AB23B97|nr:M23 family metallopeptidase [Paraburkholderia bannensis]
MIISPPLLPASGTSSSNENVVDPLMDAVDQLELASGVYPIAFDRRWHPGIHLRPDAQSDRVRAIADGEVIAYRVCQKAIDDGSGNRNSSAGFVLLKHQTETGDGRSITFYSLYMHLLELDGYSNLGVGTDILPAFLRTPSPSPSEASTDATVAPAAQSGAGKHVYRKDVLGLVGGCHGQRHLHFEIFMSPTDFSAYFNSTLLDNKSPATPASTKDYWGNSYYIVPPGRPFLAQPTGTTADGKLKGVDFPTLHSQTSVNYALHVESYFHHGNKYTNCWKADSDGTRTLLTQQPIKETDYEYDMYNRASKLYAECPSDGYELLRFGRHLYPASSGTNASATWIHVAYAEGQEGYIDLSDDSIVKLSDADFPFFMGWKKISEENALYSEDGMCDIEELKKIASDAEQTLSNIALDANEYANEDLLCNYILTNDAVRQKLRGFICQAPTEWNKDHNEDRYARLKDPNGFYGKQMQSNPNGFNDFIKLLEQFQFWDKTELPSTLWFFHPLQFIRHFRRCGWLSKKEFTQLVPTEVLREASTMLYENVPDSSASGSIAKNHRIPLNRTFRKYNIKISTRMAVFLGNALQETQWLAKLHEDNSSQWYYPWDGRGFLQLTHAENYIKYWDFIGRKNSISQATRNSLASAQNHADHDRAHAHSYLADSASGATAQMVSWREDVGDNNNITRDLTSPADSAGFYWAMMRMAQYADKPLKLERKTVQAKKPVDHHHPDAPNPLIQKIYYHCMAFRDASASVNLPAAVGDPNHHFNGYIARCVGFAQALAVLGEMMFPDSSGNQVLLFPEDRSPRRA